MTTSLNNAFDSLNIQWTEEQDDKLIEYMDGVLSWNEKVNLTAITNREEFVVKHLIDSILCCNFPEFIQAKTIIDVGTGAGFPGVPLAVISPEKKFLLADSLNKRIKIISELTEKLSIFNVEAVHGRAEEMARNDRYREMFDLSVARAVANLSVLCEYCLPFIKTGGYLLAYKGPDAEEEAAGAKKAIEVLGGRLDRIEPVNLQGFNHNIIVIEKIKSTPKKYPRNAGTPTKEPL